MYRCCIVLVFFSCFALCARLHFFILKMFLLCTRLGSRFCIVLYTFPFFHLYQLFCAHSILISGCLSIFCCFLFLFYYPHCIRYSLQLLYVVFPCVSCYWHVFLLFHRFSPQTYIAYIPCRHPLLWVFLIVSNVSRIFCTVSRDFTFVTPLAQCPAKRPVRDFK